MASDLCAFRYRCERGHDIDWREPLTACPAPCGGALVKTLHGRTEDGYLSPDEKLRRFLDRSWFYRRSANA